GSTGAHFFQTSDDGGRTFSKSAPIKAQGMRIPYYRQQITQLKSGRIIVPFYEFCGRRNYEMTWKRAPWSWSSMCYSYVAYSDDEGRTWKQSVDDVIIVPAYFTDGYTDAFVAFEEPTVVELKDSKLLMLGRCRMGRLFQSISSDGGAHWSIAEPTELAASYAPGEMRRIPKTGDLVVCWSQISKAEIVGGLNRHRLSLAISVDEGKTWGNFKNLYSLDDYNYVRPDRPQPTVPGDKWVKMLREKGGPVTIAGRGSVGTENVYVLPEDRTRYHRTPASIRTCYPLMCITDKEVLVTYDMGVPEKMPSALDIFPIEWLYKPIVPPGPYAELYIDGKPVDGADVSIEDGTPFGWGDVMGKALGVKMKRTRVPVRTFLDNHGARVPQGGWKPKEGAKGVMRAEKKKP
ncbi:MAG: sialidase family protein, partial [Planctomycetota bacterium]|nr:sialidase family protein [Planctomycetota bacterium]